MRRIVLAIGRRPRLTLLLMLAVTVTGISGLTRLSFDSSLASLTLPDDPVRVFNEEVREQFGDEEIGVVVLLAPNVYDVEVVGALKGLTDELAGVGGVSRTLSLTNASDPTSDVFSPPPLLPRGPITERSVAHLRERAAANPIYVPNLVSEAGDAAGVTVFFRHATDTEDENRVDADVQAVLDGFEGPGEIHYTGVSHIRVRAVRLMRADLLWFLPISLFFMMIVLWIAFGSLRATILPLCAVALGVGFLTGSMGWTDTPITLTTLVLPSLLLVIGGSYSIHVVHAYLELPEEEDGQAPEQRLLATLSSVGLPVLVSALTTGVGFGSLAIHPIPAIAGLGKWALMGICAVAAGCLIGVPVALMSLPERLIRGTGSTQRTDRGLLPLLDNLVVRVGGYAIDNRVKVFAVALVAFGISAVGATHIRVDTDFLKAFRPDSEIRLANAAVAERLVGPNPVSVILTASTPDYFRNISALRQVKDFQDFVEGMDVVGASVSLIDYLEELDLGLQATGGMVVNDEGELVDMPPPPSFWDAPKEQLPQLFQLVATSPKTFSGLVDSRFQRLHITLRTSLSGSLATAELREDILTFSRAMFPRGVDVELAGAQVIMASASNRVIGGQVESLALAFTVIFLTLAVMFLSMRVGLAAMIPNVLPVCVFFGVMGWAGVELNLATSIIGAVALGISVDDTIHYMARLNAIVKTTPNRREALLLTLRAVARPVVATSVTLAAGFLVMCMSGFTVLVSFGWLSGLTMLVALVTNLVLLPAILATVPVVSVWDLVSSRLGPSPHLTIPLFRDLGLFPVRLIVLLGELRRYERDDFLVRKGEEGREMYLILAGRAEVRLGGGDTVPLGRGGIVGEMALLRHSKRGADVAALSEVEVLVIDEDFLRRLRIRYPRFASRFFVNIARILSDRLEAANRRLRDLTAD